jgi:LL-diaminopimelate aminotransferase
MAKINTNYLRLKREYIFPIIETKLAELKEKHPKADIVNMGVGDIALPLAPSIVKVICQAVEEMGQVETKRGYGPSEGYSFLKDAIAKYDYAGLGIEPDEVFISDGTNSDVANIQELFTINSVVGVPDPTYPVYLDVNIMAGRKAKVLVLPCTAKTGFVPLPPQAHCDFIYLCTPSNPTGVALTRAQLEKWVAYAKKENAILLCDNAYTAFVTSPDVPKSIYEIKGAHSVAIEFRSFSKTAGFTGLRCAYTVLPKAVKALAGKKSIPLHTLWMKRQSVKSNGIAYPIQRGAEASLTKVGKKETEAQVKLYLKQAKLLKDGLTKLGFSCYGGIDAPYVWVKTPKDYSSWEFFDLLLEHCHLICIPGSGFGKNGDGYVRFSAFTTEEKVKEALKRIKQCAIK